MKTVRGIMGNQWTAFFVLLAFCCIIPYGIGVVNGSATRTSISSLHDPMAAPVGGTEETTQEPWWLARSAAVTASDTPLNATTRTWTGIKAKAVEIPSSWNTISLAFYAYGDGNGGGDPNGGTFSWRIYVCRKCGPAQLVAYGTAAVGEMVLSHDPTDGTVLTLTNEDYKWAELPVLTASVWPSSADVSGTTDDVGTINFDPLGAWGFYVEITSLANATTLYPVFTGR